MDACCQQDPFGNVKLQGVQRAGKSENIELLGSGETQLEENSHGVCHRKLLPLVLPHHPRTLLAYPRFAVSHDETGKLHAPRGIVQGLS